MTAMQRLAIAESELRPRLGAKIVPAQTAEIWTDVVSITELADQLAGTVRHENSHSDAPQLDPEVVHTTFEEISSSLRVHI